MSVIRGQVREWATGLAGCYHNWSARLVAAASGGEGGQDLVEYALTAAIVVLGLLLALFGFQIVVELVLHQVCDGIDTARGLSDPTCINLS
jgi:hypothetical protein